MINFWNATTLTVSSLSFFLRDRFRSVTNIYYHSLGTVITYEVVKAKLPPLALESIVVSEDQGM